MKFLADESIDRQIVNLLRSDGHEVQYVAEIDPGITDDDVLKRANEENAILLTADKDFGELVFRQKRISMGVILIRLAGLSPVRKAKLVTTAIDQHLPELTSAFTVIVPSSIRIRRQDH